MSSRHEAELDAPPAKGGQRRMQRRRAAAARQDYTEDNPELDAILGTHSLPKSRRTEKPDVQALRRKLESGCPAAPASCDVAPSAVPEMLRREGFRRPLVVQAAAAGNAAATRRAIGLRLPLDVLTARGLAKTVGGGFQIPTMDVHTQDSGPRMTLRQLAEYYGTPPQARKRLINVVSFSLADTPLADMIAAPDAVRALDLVSCVWPCDDEPRPETLLYALLGPKGAYTDWHVDMGGSAVWYHVVKGCKVFMLAPPTTANAAAFEAWSNSPRQASAFLGDVLEGCQRITLRPGDTMFLPSAWPHAVSTPEDSVVVGGNFLHQMDYAAIAEVYASEQRLGVQPKFQFPLFRRLMWHAAAAVSRKLRRADRVESALEAGGVSLWEGRGLTPLVQMLRGWRAQGGGARRQDIPEDVIRDPDAFLDSLQRLAEAAARAAGPAPPAPGVQQDRSLNGGRGSLLVPLGEAGGEEPLGLDLGPGAGGEELGQAFEDLSAPDALNFLDTMSALLGGHGADAGGGLPGLHGRSGAGTLPMGEAWQLRHSAGARDALGAMIPISDGSQQQLGSGGQGPALHNQAGSGGRRGARQPPQRATQRQGLAQLQAAVAARNAKAHAALAKAPKRRAAAVLDDSDGDSGSEEAGWAPAANGTGQRAKRQAGTAAAPARRSAATPPSAPAASLPKHRRLQPAGLQPVGRRAAATAAASAADKAAAAPPTAAAPSLANGQGSEGGERAAALRRVQSLQSQRAAVQREEGLLAKVRGGGVALKDGGGKLAERLAQRRAEVEALTNELQGRVYSFVGDQGRRSGPFTSAQLGVLVREGLLEAGTDVVTADGRSVSIDEAVFTPEPLTATLLREAEQQGEEERYKQYMQQVQQRGAEERRPLQARPAAAAAEPVADRAPHGQAADVIWSFKSPSTGQMEGPFSVGELRGMFADGRLKTDIMVHDEEGGVTTRLFALLGYGALADLLRPPDTAAPAAAPAPVAQAAAAGHAEEPPAAAAPELHAGWGAIKAETASADFQPPPRPLQQEQPSSPPPLKYESAGARAFPPPGSPPGMDVDELPPSSAAEEVPPPPPPPQLQLQPGQLPWQQQQLQQLQQLQGAPALEPSLQEHQAGQHFMRPGDQLQHMQQQQQPWGQAPLAHAPQQLQEQWGQQPWSGFSAGGGDNIEWHGQQQPALQHDGDASAPAAWQQQQPAQFQQDATWQYQEPMYPPMQAQQVPPPSAYHRDQLQQAAPFAESGPVPPAAQPMQHFAAAAPRPMMRAAPVQQDAEFPPNGHVAMQHGLGAGFAQPQVAMQAQAHPRPMQAALQPLRPMMLAYPGQGLSRAELAFQQHAMFTQQMSPQHAQQGWR